MTEQDQTPDVTDDTEGHRYSRAADGLDDVEGVDSVDDDTEGHVRGRAADDIDDDDDDVEGHRRVL